MKKQLMLAVVSIVAAFCAALAHAQWPEHAVRLVVPFPAGGPTDAVARSLARHAAVTLGQPVIVENKPGADGAIAAQAVASAPADGHTLLFATSSVMALPVLRPDVAFRASDFAPVAAVGRFAFGMFVFPGVGSHGMADFIAYARAHP